MLPIYVMNLDRRPDRWKAISDNLVRLGLTAERISAIDGRLLAERDASFVDGSNPAERSVRAAERGCLLSHLECLETFLRTTHPAALVLEDDAVLASDLPALLESMDWWPQGPLIVKLEAVGGKPHLLGPRLGMTPCGRDLRPICWAHNWAAAYLINREGAEIVVKAAPDLGMTADSMLFHMVGSPVARLLRPVLVNPGLARQQYQGDRNSDIGHGVGVRNRARALGRASRMIYKARILMRRVAGQVKRIPTRYADRATDR